MTGTKHTFTHLLVSGTVQGVFFRAKTQKHAQSLGLKGYVKNLSDGTVEIIVMGEDVDELIRRLKGEPSPVSIDNIIRSTHISDTEYTDFSVQ